MSLLQKMKIDPGQLFYLLHAPESLAEQLTTADTVTRVGKNDQPAQVLVFARDRKEVADKVMQLPELLAPDARFWIAYPKKSGTVPTDISRDAGWEALREAGFEPVTLVALDADWSALRFREKERIRKMVRAVPMKDREMEGIDFASRTVTLPGDLAAALQEHPGLPEFFNAYSFSHQKEYVEAVVEAKKPETRARRIVKMVEMLQEQLERKKK